MSIQTRAFYGSQHITGDLTVTNTLGSNATFQSLTIGGPGGSSYPPMSTDGTMAADSNVLVPTQRAVKTYVDTADAQVLSTAAAYTNDRTGSSFMAPTTFENATYQADVDNPIYYQGVSGAASNTLTTGIDYYGDLRMESDAVSDPINMVAPITYVTSLRAGSGARVHVNVFNIPNNDRWVSVPIRPFPVAGVTAPTLALVLGWVTYSFPGASDATYFGNVTIPFDGNWGTEHPQTNVRVYIRYSTSGTSTNPITFRTTVQSTEVGTVLGAGSFADTTLTPSTATANTMYGAELLLPAGITTKTMVGPVIPFTFQRLGSVDTNNDDMYVWSLTLVYNHFAMAASTSSV